VALYQYDPKQFSAIVGGKIMQGFTDGTYIKIKRNEDAYNVKIGVAGEGTRARNNNKSGEVEMTFVQSSQSNDDLSAFTLLDELSNTGAVPFLLNDSSGRTVVTATVGWLKKFAEVEFAKEVKDWTWTLQTHELSIKNLGGNTQIG
jgi:hypothetical protein